MEDLTDSIKAGKKNWNNFYKKTILKESVVLDEKSSETVEKSPEKSERSLKNKETEYEKVKREFNSAKEMFSHRIPYDIKKAGKSVGKSHYPVNTYDKAITVFNTPTPERKYKLLGNQATFEYERFLNDFKNKASAQGMLGQAPGDKTPYLVYNEPHLQSDVNDVLFPLVMVLYSGPDNLKNLENAAPQLLEDPIVKLFLKTRHYHRLGLSLKKEIDELSKKNSDAAKIQMPDQKPEDAEEEPIVATGTGPGKVVETYFNESEQKVSDADISNERKKVLSEGWKAYASKHKDDKNNEKPDDFTLIIG